MARRVENALCFQYVTANTRYSRTFDLTYVYQELRLTGMNNTTATSALFQADHSHRCTEAYCPQAITQINGRFFITFGHAGFNSPANNRSGYRTSARAMAASTRYARKGAAR